MVRLHYLKYTHDLSDEAVVRGWVENPYWQYLSGMEFFCHEPPHRPVEHEPLAQAGRRGRQRGAFEADDRDRPQAQGHKAERA